MNQRHMSLSLLCFGLILLQGAIAIAAPTITASPNPVMILFTAKTGTTTITWDAGNDHPAAQVWLSIDGGSRTIFDGDPKGVKIATVSPGKIYKFELLTGNMSFLASVTVTAKKKYITLEIPIIFFENINVEAHGTYAKITFKTLADCLPAAFVSLEEPLNFPPASAKDEPMWSNKNDIIRTTFAQAGTDHEAILVNLEPDKLHHYVLSAHNNQNDKWYKVAGSFRTLKRQITVNFDKVKVTDDSDDVGAGELAFAFRINGNLSPNGKNLTWVGDIDTDETKNINRQGTILTTAHTIKINVVGFDNDETDFPLVLHSCGDVPLSEREGSGENDCGEWTAKSGVYDTTILADGEDPNAPVTKSFTLNAYPVEDDSELAFRLTGSYTISYVE
jgi:hypothetical protein